MKTNHGVFSYTICAALLVGACAEGGGGDVGIAEQAASSVASGAVTATLETTSSWSGGFCQSVTIKNAGTAITDWTLSIATNGAAVSNLWSAAQTTSGTTMTVKPVSYNKNIAGGSSVNFGYCGTGGSQPTLTSIVVSGGSSGSGGAAATGGTTATGGTKATGGTPSTCSEANVQVCSSSNSSKVGKHCGLTYEIWTDSSNSCMTNTAEGFKASWTTANGNYLARKGIRPGSASPIVTYSATYQPNGNSYLAVYGWTQNPLIEYYIVDSWGTWRPPGTTAIGTVNADGGTYDIYRSLRTNMPSIEGNKTFYQYWSVRRAKRTSGTITVATHFNAWKQFGLNMGSFYEVSLVVEGYQSSGQADVKVVIK